MGKCGTPVTKLCLVTHRESISHREGPAVCGLLSPAPPDGGLEEIHLGACAPSNGQRPQTCQD